MVGNDSTLRTDLMKFFYGSTTDGHSGINATMKRILEVVY